MAEQINITRTGDKKSMYEELIPQVAALTSGETDFIANLSNMASALKYGMNFFWVGFYFMKGRELVLGPFQGPVTCTRINEGKGVCGMSVQKKEIIIVSDVNQFPGHISCSPESRSEIVLPLLIDQDVKLVLDVDSEKTGNFDDTDRLYLQKIIDMIKNFYPAGL